MAASMAREVMVRTFVAGREGFLMALALGSDIKIHSFSLLENTLDALASPR